MSAEVQLDLRRPAPSAVAIAAVLEAHPTREKHWLRWVEKLRAIANEAPPAAPESEESES